MNACRLQILYYTMSERSPLAGLGLPAPAVIVQPLSKPSTLTTASCQNLAVYRNTIPCVPLPECFETHLAPTLTTYTAPFNSSTLLTSANFGNRSQIHFKKRQPKLGDPTQKSSVKGPIAKAIVCLLAPLEALYWHVTSPDSCSHLQPGHVTESYK